MQALKSAVLTASLLAATAASAQSLVNGSFEVFTDVLGGDNGAQLVQGSTALTGWTVVGGELGYLRNLNAYNLAASDGIGFLDMAGYSNSGMPKGVSQLVGDLVVGQSYSLSLDVGLHNGPCVNGGDNCRGPVQVSASVDGVSQTFTLDSDAAGDVWSRYSLDFVANATSMTILIQGVSLPAGQNYIGLDNVAVSAVPEPSTFALLLAGALVAGLRARRRTD